MRIEYHPAIESELREIIEYYNKSSPGLGMEFLNEFERQVLKIASMPKRWRAVEGDIYTQITYESLSDVIYFRILENEVLRVTVLKHQRRHPNYGRHRK